MIRGTGILPVSECVKRRECRVGVLAHRYRDFAWGNGGRVRPPYGICSVKSCRVRTADHFRRLRALVRGADPTGIEAKNPRHGQDARATFMTPFRIGHGYDLHRLQTGRRLMLGGIQVADTLSPVAHSDGDVALHALVDALLGAMGWGDIGELFPNTDVQWKDAASRVFVEEVFARVKAAGYIVGNCDITILAERPKLKPFKPAIRENIAKMLEVAPERVNVKAGTNEECDAIGRGEAIASHAVVLLATRTPPF